MGVVPLATHGSHPLFQMTGGSSRGGHCGSDIQGELCYTVGMSAALQPMTAEEFLAWEERQEERYEFDGFHPVAMTGGTYAHGIIGGNVRTELSVRLRGSRCTPLGPDMKIVVAGRFRYPDAIVVCSPVDRKATVIADPVVVFEVLSDSTARTDHFDKLREYTATPSIRRYVILEQDAIGATVYVRDGDRMIVETVARGETLRLPEIAIEIPIDELYRGVEPDATAASG
jgi:Uma2 family endonuclease